MALSIIAVGTTANDGTGDPLRTAFEKINDNFSEVQFPSSQAVAGEVGGSFTSGYSYNTQEITAEAATETTGLGSINGWKRKHTYGGSSLKGARQTEYVEANFTATSSPENTNKNYVARVASINSTSGDGGTGTAVDTASGSIFGDNINVRAKLGSLNLYGVVGSEIDVQMTSGASCYGRFGQTVVAWGTNRGSGHDAAFTVATAHAQTASWKVAFQVGGDFWGTSAPLTSDGVVIKAGAAFTTKDGIDLSNVTFTGNFLKGPGFSVDGQGKIAGDMSGFTITADGAVKTV